MLNALNVQQYLYSFSKAATRESGQRCLGCGADVNWWNSIFIISIIKGRKRVFKTGTRVCVLVVKEGGYNDKRLYSIDYLIWDSVLRFHVYRADVLAGTVLILVTGTKGRMRN